MGCSMSSLLFDITVEQFSDLGISASTQITHRLSVEARSLIRALAHIFNVLRERRVSPRFFHTFAVNIEEGGTNSLEVGEV